MLHGVEHGKCPNARTIAPQLVGVDDLWHVEFPQQTDEKGLGRLSIPVLSKENVEHAPMLVHGPPQLVGDPANLHVYLVQMPPRTPAGFSVAQFFSVERRELDVPLSERLVADVDTTLVEQRLNVTLAEREAVIKPQGVADDA